MGVITRRQIAFGNSLRAAEAFGHVLAGHFKMDAARMRAFGPAHLKERFYFLQYTVKGPRFITIVCLDGIAMHRV